MLLLGSFAVAAHALVAPGGQAAIAGLMKKHDPILLYVQNLLSESTAEDAGALYAWCRRLDQIVDDPPAGSSVADTRAALDEWAARLDSLCDGQPRDEMDDFGEDTPMGRPGQPNEVAPSFLFLACEDSSYMSGQVLHPNGGIVVGS